MSRFIEGLRAQQVERERQIQRERESELRVRQREEEVRRRLGQEEEKRGELARKFFKESDLERMVGEMQRLLSGTSIVGGRPHHREIYSIFTDRIGLKWFKDVSVADRLSNLFVPKEIEITESFSEVGRIKLRESFLVVADQSGNLIFTGAGLITLPHSSWSARKSRMEECLEEVYKNPKRTIVEFRQEERPEIQL